MIAVVKDWIYLWWVYPGLLILLLSGCSPGRNSLRECGERLLSRNRKDYFDALDRDFRELFRVGADGLPEIFRVWVEDPDEIQMLVLWDAWVTRTVEGGYNDEYRLMFPWVPRESRSLIEQLDQQPYLIRIGKGTYSFDIYNPIRGYERVNGFGTWPSDLPLERIVAPGMYRGQHIEREGMPISVLKVELQRWAREPVEEFPCEPPDCMRELVRRGPKGIVAIFEVWVEEKIWTVPVLWDIYIRNASVMGFLKYPFLQRILTAEPAELLKAGILVRLDEGPTEFSGLTESIEEHAEMQEESASVPSRFGGLIDDSPLWSLGKITIVNPILVYESLLGKGTWPDDMPLKRIQAPHRWSVERRI